MNRSHSTQHQLWLPVRSQSNLIRTWIPGHQDKVSQFEAKLVDSLSTCMQSNDKSQKVRREKMWTRYQIRGFRTVVPGLKNTKTYYTEI